MSQVFRGRPTVWCPLHVHIRIRDNQRSGGRLAAYCAKFQCISTQRTDQHFTEYCWTNCATRAFQSCKISCQGRDQSVAAGGPTTLRSSFRNTTSTLLRSFLKIARCPAAKQATGVITVSIVLYCIVFLYYVFVLCYCILHFVLYGVWSSYFMFAVCMLHVVHSQWHRTLIPSTTKGLDGLEWVAFKGLQMLEGLKWNGPTCTTHEGTKKEPFPKPLALDNWRCCLLVTSIKKVRGRSSNEAAMLHACQATSNPPSLQPAAPSAPRVGPTYPCCGNFLRCQPLLEHSFFHHALEGDPRRSATSLPH